MTPAIVSTIDMTIAKRGRSTNVRENVFISSMDFLSESFIWWFFLLLLDRRDVVGVEVVVHGRLGELDLDAGA